MESRRDVLDFFGDGGFGVAKDAIAAHGEGDDEAGDDEEGQCQGEESNKVGHGFLVRLGEVEDYAAYMAALLHELEDGFPLGPGEGLGDNWADFALGNEAGGLFDVASGGSDGAEYVEFAEDDFGEGEFGFGAFDLAEKDEAGVGGEGAEGLGEEGGPDGVEGDICAAVLGEGEDDFGEVELARGDYVGCAEGFEGGGLGFVGGDGEDAGAAEVGELDQVGTEAAGSAGDEDGVVGLDLGFFDGFEGDADGAGEEAGLGPGDFGADFDEGGLADGQELGHAALHAVADGLTFGAEAFLPLGTELAVSAGVG